MADGRNNYMVVAGPAGTVTAAGSRTNDLPPSGTDEHVYTETSFAALDATYSI
jgi:hypothetical protein